LQLEINALDLNVFDEQIIDSKTGSPIPIETRFETRPGESIFYQTKFLLPLDRPQKFFAKFSGRLLDTGLGFYRSYYVDSESSEKR